MTDRRTMLRGYRQNPPPMGVYRIRNTVTGDYLLGSSPNVPGALNRSRFGLEMGDDRCRELQEAWNEYGPGAFAFEVLDTLDPPGDPEADPREELALLEEMWRARLGESERGTEYSR